MKVVGVTNEDNGFVVRNSDGSLLTRMQESIVDTLIDEGYMDDRTDFDGLANYMESEHLIRPGTQVMAFDEAKAIWDIESTPVNLQFYIDASGNAAFCDDDSGKITQSSLAIEAAGILARLADRIERGDLDGYLPGIEAKDEVEQFMLFDTNGNGVGKGSFTRAPNKAEMALYSYEPVLLNGQMPLALFSDDPESMVREFVSKEASLTQLCENLKALSVSLKENETLGRDGRLQNDSGVFIYNGTEAYDDDDCNAPAI